MAANTRLATAVQILCVIAYKGPEATTSEVIARSLKTNPVVVRRLLKDLQAKGLVTVRPGKDGGVQMGCDPARITLDHIYKAVEADNGVFALRPRGNLKCPVDSAMKDLLTPVFHATDLAVEKTLRQTTLSKLMRELA